MKKLIAMFGILALAACGGDEAEVEAVPVGEVDAVAEPAPGAVVTPPVMTVPVEGDTMSTMPMGTDTMAMPAAEAPSM